MKSHRLFASPLSDVQHTMDMDHLNVTDELHILSRSVIHQQR